ncbi:MAG: hypothetical protein JSV04_00585 [Candidatus Heimdallarchaeota archaeon]|nr:MAG: hypothetical protein JSV04_00585 [Candidatus Heimdallarchaeota archaeon]
MAKLPIKVAIFSIFPFFYPIISLYSFFTNSSKLQCRYWGPVPTKYGFIPDQNRNSIYSLIPTLILLINIPYVGVGGLLLDHFGLPLTFMLLNFIGILAPLFY